MAARKTYIHDATALTLDGQQRSEGIVDEHDVGDVAGDRAAAAHGHPDLCALERHPSAEAADGLGDLGAQLVGERDERDRFQRG